MTVIQALSNFAGSFAVPLVIVTYLAALLALLWPVQRLIHIFQLESYKRPQLFLRLKEDPSHRRRLWKDWRNGMLWQLPVLALLLGFSIYQAIRSAKLGCVLDTRIFVAIALAYALMWGDAFRHGWLLWKKEPSKKPLAVTARVKRLVGALALVLVLVALVGFFLLVLVQAFAALTMGDAGLMPGRGWLSTLWHEFAQGQGAGFVLGIGLGLAALVALATALLSRLLALASLLTQPIEKAIQRRFFNEARAKLASYGDMIRIGITGSYGKTSAKVILATILSEKYKTLATPASYNTPMGVSKVIRETLDHTYEVFIGEMGARHKGDIAEMCDLVRPQYGLITSIGPQHLETMFTIENIARTKYELVQALPAEGMAFLPGDNDICFELYKQTTKPKALFGVREREEPLYMTARNMAHGPQGSTFDLVGPAGESVRCTTQLLGEHNVQNILGCAAVAHALGLTLQQIAAGIAKAQPVEHRLQLIPTSNGVTVIDDAFNSNPAGARAALAVLKAFPGRKIIVTPGLVELGDAEAEENRAFGAAMAATVDVAILVARNAPAMKEGLLQAGFPEDNIHVVGKLAQATRILAQIGRAGDVVLFENDLPDHYESEK